MRKERLHKIKLKRGRRIVVCVYAFAFTDINHYGGRSQLNKPLEFPCWVPSKPSVKHDENNLYGGTSQMCPLARSTVKFHGSHSENNPDSVTT